MADQSVSDIVVGRLPLYLRALDVMSKSGQSFVSSHELARWLGTSSAQIRKDLSQFGEFGVQGRGYDVHELRANLRHILHLEREWAVVVVGAGRLGSAVASYPGFAQRGFTICALFDNHPDKIGQLIGNLRVRPMSELADFVQAHRVRIAMIAVPASAAQEVADQLVQAGVRAILNYAPIDLVVPPSVRVENVDPALHLQHMTYYLSEE
ncbi:MAG: redox-sensing transcriptional repressor Rex [Thermoflexales bacterium]